MQHDMNIANQGFPAFRADLNSALAALVSNNSGASAPATTFANMPWYDTTNNIFKIRNEDNDAWISVFTLDQTTDAITAIGSVTLADVVSLTGTQTLTNKTLTTPKINVINEETLNAGVTVDGLLIKDGVIPSSGLPAGSVLQVVNATNASTVSSASNTFIDTGLTASITPKFSTSKILVTVYINGASKLSSNTVCGLKLLRNSTDILLFESSAGYNGTTTNNSSATSGCEFLDSPATTSSITYKVQMCSLGNVGTAYTNLTAGGTTTSTITLTEIAG